MENLPEAPEYKLAAHLIAELRRDAVLAPYVYPHPWDRDEQAQCMNMTFYPKGINYDKG